MKKQTEKSLANRKPLIIEIVSLTIFFIIYSAILILGAIISADCQYSTSQGCIKPITEVMTYLGFIVYIVAMFVPTKKTRITIKKIGVILFILLIVNAIMSKGYWV